MRISDWISDVCSSDLLLYRSFQRLQAAPCLPLLFQAGKLGGHVDAAEIGGLLDLVQTVPTPVVVEHVARNGEQQPTQRGRLLDVAVADQPAPGFLCQISGTLRPGPTSAEATQPFGLVLPHATSPVVSPRWRRPCRQTFR